MGEIMEPKKWKDTIDPFKLNLKKFKIIKILGYPHARNDVFYVKGSYNNKNIYAYIKYCSIKESNLLKEISFLTNNKIPNRPVVLEYDEKGMYVVTKAIRGKRLSQLLKEDSSLSSLDFLQAYGEKLASIHKLNIECEMVKDRSFFHLPSEEYCKEYGLLRFREYLEKNKPSIVNYCFVHGDMHYANVLWRHNKICAILDYELAGISNKEFDIAWCIINRPSQKFMNTKQEINCFLKGYSKINDYNYDLVIYYMNLIYLHFYKIGYKDEKYRDYIYSWLKENCK